MDMSCSTLEIEMLNKLLIICSSLHYTCVGGLATICFILYTAITLHGNESYGLDTKNWNLEGSFVGGILRATLYVLRLTTASFRVKRGGC